MESGNNENIEGDRVKVSVELPTYTMKQREQKLHELLMESIPEMFSKDHSEDRYIYSYIHSKQFLW